MINTFLYSETKIIDNTTEDYVVVDAHRFGEVICLQVFSCVDLTSSPTRLDFGFMRGADFIPVSSASSPAAGYTVTLGYPVYYTVDEVPAVRVVGGVVGDRVQVIIAGYRLNTA